MKRGPALLVIGLSLGTTLVATAPPRSVAAAEMMAQCKYTGYTQDYLYCYYDDPWASWPYISCFSGSAYADCHYHVWQQCGEGPGNWVVTFAWCEEGPGDCNPHPEYGEALEHLLCVAYYQPL